MSEMKCPVAIFCSEEDGDYITIAPDFKGCSAFGGTPQETLRELETANELWLSVAQQGEAPIPESTRMIA
jgi:predicted RNase H-like HicB family nuclease